MSMNKIKIPLMVLVLILLGSTATAAYYFYNQYRKLSSDPQFANKEELSLILGKLSKYMVMPSGEVPSLATVTDKEKLKEQPFFSKSENGDKVLIFTKARKAILYRPSVNKIIDVAPITIGGETSSAAPQPTVAEEKIRVAIYNGTSTVGMAKEVEKKLADIRGLSFVTKEDAVKSYTKTIVVDLSGRYSDIAGGMAQLLEGEVGSLPDGEKQPNADMVIIAGK